ncbi:MAG: hypothetical protein E6K97_04335 [Thaumarchaeota archaeon]|nr:MAG: hypothetical protein E6K97_04335 [Nitrososphaerota archaeon]
MPELWLNYGSTDVILDLRVENLSLIENSKFDIRNEESLDQEIESIPISDYTILIPLDASNSTVQLTSRLVSLAEIRGITLPIETIPTARRVLSNKIQSQNITLIEKSNDHFHRRTNERGTIFISKVNIDPFFGYSGTPTNLLREFEQDKMNQAFHSRVDDLPHPGEKSQPIETANRFCESMQAKSIEIISNNSGINNFFYGEIIQSFQSATKKLDDLSIENQQELKSLILGTNIDSNSSSTLSNSLDLLWNSTKVLKRNAIVVIISENSKGFGSKAMEKFAYGEIKLEDYSNISYIEGLEHLMFINELREKYNMAILSSLPKYYLNEKFGFEIFSNIQEAAEKILGMNGKSHRISIIQDPNIAIFKKDN